MNTIELLDKNTIDKIAAGEVVERPASIVKELVENAIDAKSTIINVEIKEGGIGFIRITDNGQGIPKDQIQKAFLRHSTSKIRSVDDLLTIGSLGFRGEALSSIAAIAQVELITKTPGSLTGSRYIIEGGQEKKLEEIGAPEGTTILIRNVFFNTPARKKFLKSATTEAGYIISLMERLALSHPEIAFNFIQNGQVKLHTSGNGKIKDVAFSIFGRDITNNLTNIEADESGISIRGFVCKPVVSRGNRNYENYFINGRYIKNNIIARAIEDAYKPYMMQHRYPFTLLLIEVPGDVVDVNVHPSKQEVRFDNGDVIYSVIYKSIFDALSKKDLIPEVSFDDLKTKQELDLKPKKEHFEPFEVHRIETFKNDNINNNSYTEVLSEADKVQEESQYNKEPLFSGNNFEKNISISSDNYPKAEQLSLDSISSDFEIRPEIKIIGQTFDTYWIVEYQEKLFIIDQHAAHEKVLYERILKEFDSKEHSSQLISPSIIISLSPQEENVLKDYMEDFLNMGFVVDSFGGSEYAISAVPVNIFNLDVKEIFIDMLDGLLDGRTINGQIIKDKMATMACKAAVKGNNKLSSLEAKKLIEEMFSLDNPYNCPHGRPTVISMSKYELEKKFKRIV